MRRLVPTGQGAQRNARRAYQARLEHTEEHTVGTECQPQSGYVDL